MTSDAPASPPTLISASSFGSAPSTSSKRTMIRDGCSREAAFAAAIAVSAFSKSVWIIRVRTRPSATAPPCSRIWTKDFDTLLTVVLGRFTIMDVSSFCHRFPSLIQRTLDPRIQEGSHQVFRFAPRTSLLGQESSKKARLPDA